MTAIDWNRWREAYPGTSFAEQRAFYDRVYELHPDQARYSVKAFGALLEHIAGEKLYLVELGGWNGGFAAEVLPNHPEILRWINWEISRRAVDNSVCDDDRYVGVPLADWYWSDPQTCDVFVASHVIEHLTWEQLRGIFDSTEADWLYLQAPLNDSPTDWTNYHGSHILEVGWSEIVAELESRGYSLIDSLTRPGVRCFCR